MAAAAPAAAPAPNNNVHKVSPSDLAEMAIGNHGEIGDIFLKMIPKDDITEVAINKDGNFKLRFSKAHSGIYSKATIQYDSEVTGQLITEMSKQTGKIAKFALKINSGVVLKIGPLSTKPLKMEEDVGGTNVKLQATGLVWGTYDIEMTHKQLRAEIGAIKMS